jgi:hypothetical protein
MIALTETHTSHRCQIRQRVCGLVYRENRFLASVPFPMARLAFHLGFWIRLTAHSPNQGGNDNKQQRDDT